MTVCRLFWGEFIFNNIVVYVVKVICTADVNDCVNEVVMIGLVVFSIFYSCRYAVIRLSE